MRAGLVDQHAFGRARALVDREDQRPAHGTRPRRSSAARAMPSAFRPKWSSRKPALPVGAKCGTPRMRIGTGRCCASSSATAPPSPPRDGGFLHGDEPSRFHRRAQHRRLVERHDGRHVQHPRGDPLPGQQVGRREGARDHDAAGEQAHIIARAELHGAAGGEVVVRRHHRGDLEAADAHEHGRAGAGGPAQGGARLRGIGRHCDGDVAHRAHPGEVFDRVMRGPQLAVRHAGALPAQHHVMAAVGDVGLDLLERAGGEEGRGGGDERDHPAIREPGGDAHHVLLGDADIDQPVGKFLAERDEVAGADGVVADGDDAAVGARECDQLVAERLPAVERRAVGGCRVAHDAGQLGARLRDLLGRGHLVVPLHPVLHERGALALDRVRDQAARPLRRAGRRGWRAAPRGRARRTQKRPSRTRATCRRAVRGGWSPRCARPAAAGCDRRSR